MKFDELLEALPEESEISKALGTILPFRDDPYEFQFTGEASREYTVSLNGETLPSVSTDANGKAVIIAPADLSPGEYQLLLKDTEVDTAGIFREYSIYFTIKHLASLFTALGEILDKLDDEIEDMDRARSLQTVSSTYMEKLYGQAVRQAFPETFMLEDYRQLLIGLRQLYRHFGGMTEGPLQAVAYVTSVTPFLVPANWRKVWYLGGVLSDNLNMETLTRSLYSPLRNLNSQSRCYIHPKVTSAGPDPAAEIRQPPFTQQLTVEFTVATEYLIIEGTDWRGDAILERVPDPSITGAVNTIYKTTQKFQTVTDIDGTGLTAGSAIVGIAASQFVTINAISSFVDVLNETLSDLSWVKTEEIDGVPTSSMRFGDQFIVLAPDGEATVLPTADRYATARTTRFNSFSLVGGTSRHDRLRLQLDENEPIDITLTTGGVTPTTTEVVTDINAAFALAPNYTSTQYTVEEVTGTEGSTATFIRLSAKEDLGRESRIRILPCARDAAPEVFGLPVTQTYLASAAAVNATTLSCVDTSQMPEESFDIHIRGRRFNDAVGATIYGTNPSTPSTCEVAVPTYTFSSSDIGGALHILGMSAGANNGLHRIIGYNSTTSRAVIKHENHLFAFTGSFHLGTSSVVYSPAERHTVSSNDKAGTITLTAALTKAWEADAVVEVADSAPYTVQGQESNGSITITLDSTLHPLRSTGDSLSAPVANVVTLTSLRAGPRLDSIDIGDEITLTNCINEDNNGAFFVQNVTPGVLGVSAGTIEFTNALGVAETSPFNWAVNEPTYSVDDEVQFAGGATPLATGADEVLPDGWVKSPSTLEVYLNNSHSQNIYGNGAVRAYPSSGLFRPCPVIVRGTASDTAIYLEKEAKDLVQFKGLPLHLSLWVGEHHDGGPTIAWTMQVSFDGTNFSDPIVLTEEAIGQLTPLTKLGEDGLLGDPFRSQFEGPNVPFNYSGDFFIPYDAETVVIRLYRNQTAGAADFAITIEDIQITRAYGPTDIARSAKRSAFGELLYCWSAGVLSDGLKEAVGLPLPYNDEELVANGYTTDDTVTPTLAATKGHIDYLANAHGYWDRADLSELNDSGATLIRLNVIGEFDDTDWYAADLTNLEVVLGTPEWLTYLSPTRESHIIQEVLSVDDVTRQATLLQVSNHSGTFPLAPNPGLTGANRGSGAILYEVFSTQTTLASDGGRRTVIPPDQKVPLPGSLDGNSVLPWFFVDASTIEIDAAYFNPDNSYVIEYDALLQATGVAHEVANPADYLWIANLSQHVRYAPTFDTLAMVVNLTFDGQFQAILPSPVSDADTLVLTKDTGVKKSILPTGSWTLVDDSTIRLASEDIDTASVYTLSYTARVLQLEPTAKAVLEWRYGVDEVDIASAEWEVIEDGQVLSPVFNPLGDVTSNAFPAWVQFRVSYTDVTLPQDLRILGIGMKGINMFSIAPKAPGLL